MIKSLDGDDDVHLYERWLEKLKRSIQCDKWGQVVEAVEMYQDLERTFPLRASRTSSVLHDDQKLKVKQRQNSAKLSLLIRLRIAAIETDFVGPSIDDMYLVLNR